MITNHTLRSLWTSPKMHDIRWKKTAWEGEEYTGERRGFLHNVSVVLLPLFNIYVCICVSVKHCIWIFPRESFGALFFTVVIKLLVHYRSWRLACCLFSKEIYIFSLFFILSYFSVSHTVSPSLPRLKTKTFPNLFVLNFWVGMHENTASQEVCCKPCFMKQVLMFSLGRWLKKKSKENCLLRF